MAEGAMIGALLFPCDGSNPISWENGTSFLIAVTEYRFRFGIEFCFHFFPGVILEIINFYITKLNQIVTFISKITFALAKTKKLATVNNNSEFIMLIFCVNKTLFILYVQFVQVDRILPFSNDFTVL